MWVWFGFPFLVWGPPCFLLRVGRFPVFLLRLCAVSGGLLCLLFLLSRPCLRLALFLGVGLVLLFALVGVRLLAPSLSGSPLLLRLCLAVWGPRLRLRCLPWWLRCGWLVRLGCRFALVFARAGRVRGGSVPWLLLRLLRVRRLMLCLTRSCLLAGRGVFFRVSVPVSVSLRLCVMPLNSSCLALAAFGWRGSFFFLWLSSWALGSPPLPSVLVGCRCWLPSTEGVCYVY